MLLHIILKLQYETKVFINIVNELCSVSLFLKWKHHNYDTLIFKYILFSVTLILSIYISIKFIKESFYLNFAFPTD